MIIQTMRKTGKFHAAAHTASVDDAHGEVHDTDSEPEEDTTEPKTPTNTERAATTEQPLLRRSFKREPRRRGGTMG